MIMAKDKINQTHSDSSSTILNLTHEKSPESNINTQENVLHVMQSDLNLKISDESENSDNSLTSLCNIENWKGKGKTQQTKKKPSKYLDQCPEIKSILNKSKLRSNKMVFLINGSKAPALKIKKKTYTVINTR